MNIAEAVELGKLRPGKNRLLCTRYLKPEMIGSLYLPDAYRGDRSQSLFELVAWNESERDKLDHVVVISWDDETANVDYEPANLPLKKGAIIQTVPWSGRDLGDGIHFLVDIPNVRAIHAWEED